MRVGIEFDLPLAGEFSTSSFISAGSKARPGWVRVYNGLCVRFQHNRCQSLCRRLAHRPPIGLIARRHLPPAIFWAWRRQTRSPRSSPSSSQLPAAADSTAIAERCGSGNCPKAGFIPRAILAVPRTAFVRRRNSSGISLRLLIPYRFQTFWILASATRGDFDRPAAAGGNEVHHRLRLEP